MKNSLLTLLLLFSNFFLSAQICPKDYSLNIQATYETLNDSDGQITITPVLGLVNPLNYEWSKNGMVLQTGIQNQIDSLNSGKYEVVITDSLNCTFKACVFIDKDSFPCDPLYLTNYHNQTIPYYTNFEVLKKPGQTGVLLELYSSSKSLLNKSYEYNTSAGGNRFIFNVRQDVYYNKTYYLVTKLVFGSDTSDFCGDTLKFTIEDFLCDLPFGVGGDLTYSDTILISYQFQTNTFGHTHGVILDIFSENNSFLGSIDLNQGVGSGFSGKVPMYLYFNEKYKVSYRIIYQDPISLNKDTVFACEDSMKFVTDDYPCNFTWKNSCADTIQRTHQIRVANVWHAKDVFLILFDSLNNSVDTILMKVAAGGTRYIITQYHVVDSNSYKAVPLFVFEHYDSTKNIRDTVEYCGDTCKFYVVPSGQARIKYEDHSVSEEHKLTESVLYPNPNGGILNLNLSGFESEKIEFRIVNSKGKLQNEGTLSNLNAAQTINVSNLISGTYYILLKTNKVSKNIPFTIIR